MGDRYAAGRPEWCVAGVSAATASREEWEAARLQLLVKEKESTRARDALARHQQPRRSYLDMTALERHEEWDDSPEGYPQTPPS